MPENRESEDFTQWVACWGNATSITDRRECTYAKDLTLRYPIRMCFCGSKLRLRFSNLTGTEPVTLTEAYLAHAASAVPESVNAVSPAVDPRGAGSQPASGDSPAEGPVAITFGGASSVTLPAGAEVQSDAVDFPVTAGETVEVSLYFEGFTQMNAGTFVTGPLSSGRYCYGNFAKSRTLPDDLSRKTNWFYFLNTIDVLTAPENFALVCFGDSITAQDWPDELALRCANEGFRHVSIIRRAVSGTRILREYSCITYAAYGLKGAKRFPVEMNVAGARAVILQHGINDIIHPVGVEVNPFRPWSDLPTVEELETGVRDIYVSHARKLGLKVWSGTLLPIEGWRTYNETRESMRQAFNAWLRTSGDFDGCVDFDAAVRDAASPARFKSGFDSGDHLHPSALAYAAMAACVPRELLCPEISN